jgi:hypothetical protein
MYYLGKIIKMAEQNLANLFWEKNTLDDSMHYAQIKHKISTTCYESMNVYVDIGKFSYNNFFDNLSYITL